MELSSQESSGEIKRREAELGSQEIKSTEMELDSHRQLDNPSLQFLNSCFPDTVFMTLFCTAC